MVYYLSYHPRDQPVGVGVGVGGVGVIILAKG